VVASQSPLSLSPDGVYSYVSHNINAVWRPPQTARYVRFDAIKEIEATGRQVRVNGELLVSAGSPSLARHLAGQLKKLQGLAKEKRSAAIAEMLRDRFDVKTIEKSISELRARSAMLQGCTNVLFSYLFIFLPIWISRFGFLRDWPILLAVLLLLTATNAFLFNRAYKVLYPDAGEERFTHWFMICFSPATAVRAHDALSRPLLERFHPLAVAKELLDGEKFKRFGAEVLVELRHPRLPLCPTTDAEPLAAEKQSREALLEMVEKFLKTNGLDIDELTRSPAPSDESCRTYCPRCRAQFTLEQGICADCGGIALLALPKGKG